jgi:large subunit ribosomal protein L20
MRIKRSNSALKKRRKTLKAAKGYWGARSTQYRVAKQAVMKSGQYAYIGRRLRKRDMRSLWITRINAGARLSELSYSKFMHGLKLTEIELNRKVLADLAVNDAVAFANLAETAKKALVKDAK